MKKLLLLGLLAMVASSTLSGCGGLAGDLYRMAQTSHDAGSCDGFRGRSKQDVENLLGVKPVQTSEDGRFRVAQYEQGNFGAAVLFEDGKVSKYFCGHTRLAGTFYRQYSETITKNKIGE